MVYKEFHKESEMKKFLLNKDELIKMKKKYPPSKGYAVVLNWVEKKLELIKQDGNDI